jgi:xylulokinase
VVGGRDICGNALGAGVVASGQAMLHLGATVFLLPTFQALPLNMLVLQQGLAIEPHLVPEQLISQVWHRAGGRLLRWFRDQIIPMEAQEAQRRGDDIYTRLLSEMPEAPARPLALPDLAPNSPAEAWPGARGVLVGLELGTSRGEIIKALLEGSAMVLSEGQQKLASVGIVTQGYRATGAGARSDRWLQLAADVLGLPVERTAQVDATALGAAMLAGLGVGAYASLQEASSVAVQVTQHYLPERKRHAHYQERGALLQALRARLDGFV